MAGQFRLVNMEALTEFREIRNGSQAYHGLDLILSGQKS